jgi:hypothetical protein
MLCLLTRAIYMRPEKYYNRSETRTVHIISVSGNSQQVIHRTQFRKTSLIFLQCFWTEKIRSLYSPSLYACRKCVPNTVQYIRWQWVIFLSNSVMCTKYMYNILNRVIQIPSSWNRLNGYKHPYKCSTPKIVDLLKQIEYNSTVLFQEF